MLNPLFSVVVKGLTFWLKVYYLLNRFEDYITRLTACIVRTFRCPPNPCHKLSNVIIRPSIWNAYVFVHLAPISEVVATVYLFNFFCKRLEFNIEDAERGLLSHNVVCAIG